MILTKKKKEEAYQNPAVGEFGEHIPDVNKVYADRDGDICIFLDFGEYLVCYYSGLDSYTEDAVLNVMQDYQHLDVDNSGIILGYWAEGHYGTGAPNSIAIPNDREKRTWIRFNSISDVWRKDSTLPMTYELRELP